MPVTPGASLSPHVTMTETEHGTVLLDERTGRYWALNATGTTVIATNRQNQPRPRPSAPDSRLNATHR